MNILTLPAAHLSLINYILLQETGILDDCKPGRKGQNVVWRRKARSGTQQFVNKRVIVYYYCSFLLFFFFVYVGLADRPLRFSQLVCLACRTPLDATQ